MFGSPHTRIHKYSSSCLVGREIVLHIFRNDEFLSNVPNNFSSEFEIVFRIRNVVECKISCRRTASSVWSTGSPCSLVRSIPFAYLLRDAHVICSQRWCTESLRADNIRTLTTSIRSPCADRIGIRTRPRGRQCRYERKQGFAQVATLQPRDCYLLPPVPPASAALTCLKTRQFESSHVFGRTKKCP